MKAEESRLRAESSTSLHSFDDGSSCDTNFKDNHTKASQMEKLTQSYTAIQLLRCGKGRSGIVSARSFPQGIILLTMLSLGNIVKVPTHPLLIFMLTTGAVLGCGTVPAASRTWRFNVTGFSLPVAMAFSTDVAARAQVPQISPNSGSAEAFVKRLITQGVLDVLEQQGRAAGLPDFAITTILNQLGINILYTPLPCPKVSVNPSDMFNRDQMMKTTCVIFGNTVTTTCLAMGVPGAVGNNCMLNMPMHFTPIPPQHLSISGTLTTSNLIMANWNREMWQSVVNRVLRETDLREESSSSLQSFDDASSVLYNNETPEAFDDSRGGDESTTSDDEGSVTVMKKRSSYHLKPSAHQFMGGVRTIELVGSKCYRWDAEGNARGFNAAINLWLFGV
ncbi:hypothetical protein KIN20_022261 [Parelaphostrongylus tenuis]|uniref:Uncharacterized protein n=1 Tax=Parelaphostrongylus tenuis TaxID=148309 RepID=A0AAD5NBI0_PARTN|nr:hypothetical protein KIN20_022261 [Parelaphostrongylus tenuis]